MTDFLRSLKSDLTSRRMLPLLVLAAIAVAVAVGYAVTGGSSPATTASAPSTATTSVPSVEGPEVSSAPADPHAALAETTSGGSYQHGGHVRNPFKPLPASEASKGSGSASSSGSGNEGSSSSGASGSGKGSGGSGANEGASESKENAPETSSETGAEGSGEETEGGAGEGAPKASGQYKVSAKLQRLDEEGKPKGKPQVFTDIVLLAPLPSKKKPLVELGGVSSDGSKAIFLLVEPAILHGPAKCKPGPANCEGIELAPHKGEELQYEEADGSIVSYELTVTRLKKAAAGAQAAKASESRVSKFGMRLALRRGLMLPPAIASPE